MPLTFTVIIVYHSDVIKNEGDEGGNVDVGVAFVTEIATVEPNYNQSILVLSQHRATRGSAIRFGHVPYVRSCSNGK